MAILSPQLAWPSAWLKTARSYRQFGENIALLKDKGKATNATVFPPQNESDLAPIKFPIHDTPLEKELKLKINRKSPILVAAIGLRT